MTIRRTLLNALAASSFGGSQGSAAAGVAVKELSLVASDGVQLAAQRWSTGETTNETIFCLHGWMDNCRSFHLLAPALSRHNLDVVALDLPGHGRSSHKSTDAPPMVQAEMVVYVAEALDYYQTHIHACEQVTLIGHSLGAGIASLYTASFPEQVSQLVLLEGAGFLAREAKDTAKHVRNHVQRRRSLQTLQKKPRIYPSLKSAIETRQKSARALPGDQTLSFEAARELVERATRNVDDGVQFQHDPRFSWPSIQYMTQEQNEGIFRSIAEADDIKVGVLLADQGWPFVNVDRTLSILQPQMVETLPGSHYFHADPETADAVVENVLEFFGVRVTR